MKRTAFFKSGGSSSPEQRHKAGRQSIRGRISAPIPMPDPLEPSNYPHSVPPSIAYAPRQEATIPENDQSVESTLPHIVSAVPEEPEAAEQDIVPSIEPAEDDVGIAPVPEPSTAAEMPIFAEPMPSLPVPKARVAAASPASQLRSPSPEQSATEPAQQQQQAPFIQPVPQAGPTPSSLSVGQRVSASGSASVGNSSTSPAFRQRTNVSSMLRYSELSGTSGAAGTSANTTVSDSPMPQRKKSTLRGAFSRLFGRRKKIESRVLPLVATQGHDMTPQHRSVRSDPTVLSRPRDPEPKRSASLPITEYDRALRSHSIDPEDVAGAESTRNSFQVDLDAGNGEGPSNSSRYAVASSSRSPAPAQRRRRFNNNSVDVLSGSEWTGLSPRPASAHGRGSGNRLSGFALSIGNSTGDGAAGFGLGALGAESGSSGAHPDPSEIGRAITSDSPGATDLGSRRRSRSLSGLYDLAHDQAQPRRRSDEIRYWRESYNLAFLSPISTAHGADTNDDGTADGHDEADQGHEERKNSDGDDDDGNKSHGCHDHGSALTEKERTILFQGADDMAAGASLLHSQPDSPVAPQDERLVRPNTPPQPFSFGNMSSLGAMSEGMKITDANSLDARLGGLETRMLRMERVVDQLCHSVPGFKSPLSASSMPSDQIPRSVPPFPEQFSSSLLPHASPGGKPAIPPIPTIFQTRTTTVPSPGGYARDGGNPYLPTASSSRYSNSRHSGHSGHSFDSDMHSHMSFGDGQTYIGSLHPPSSSATQAQSILAPTSGPSVTLSPSSLSTSTVRGATSLPALGAAGESTASLVAQLEAERTVRQTLETQVKKLNERVNTLSTTMYAMLREPVAKPRSSREPLTSPSHGSLREPLASATTVKAVSDLPASKIVGVGTAADVETESEGFQTPVEDVRREDRNYNYNRDDGNGGDKAEAAMSPKESRRQKKAARTLSLGQLTLGKSAVQT